MHLQDRSTAQVMRRASTGPHALMLRNALQPFVPNRGPLHGGMSGVPFRRSALGAPLTLQSSAAGVTTGAQASAIATSVGASVASAVGAGAAAGSMVPIIGTAIGIIVGLVASGVFNHRVDPEVGNFNNAIALFNSQGPAGVLNIADKYLVLAGLFDLEPGQIKGNIPIYKKYGRMGEMRFVQDMCNVIYNAAQSGQITANNTIQDVFNNVVMPWINSFGLGTMSDANANMINTIILGLVSEYITGLWKTRWFARAGDLPNWQMPAFSLPTATASTAPAVPAPSPTASPTPSPVAVASSVPAISSELASYQNGQLPAAGARVSYTKSTSGQFDSVPTGMFFEAVDSKTGAWILTNNNGNPFIDQNGVLVPFISTRTVTPSVNLALPVTSSASTASAPGVVPTASSPLITSGGGGLPVFSTSSAPVTSSSPVQPSEMTWLIGGGVLLAVILLLKRSGARAS